MNSTLSPTDDNSTLNRDVVFWLGASSIIFGCVVEFLIVCFFVKVFLSRRNNDLKSAYFLICVIGYIIDIISSGSALATQLFDPGNNTIYSVISKFTVLYSDFHLGLLSFVMGVNRCTALAFPFVNKQIWQGYPLGIIILLFILAPFSMGYRYMFGPCLAGFWKESCAATVAECYLVATVLNVLFFIATLIIIGIGILLLHINGTASSNVKRVEKRLVWQTVTSSVFLIIYYIMHYCGAILYDKHRDIAVQLYTACTLPYGLHTYLPIIILFTVSKQFRTQFFAFYGFGRAIYGDTTKVIALASVHFKK